MSVCTCCECCVAINSVTCETAFTLERAEYLYELVRATKGLRNDITARRPGRDNIYARHKAARHSRRRAVRSAQRAPAHRAAHGRRADVFSRVYSFETQGKT